MRGRFVIVTTIAGFAVITLISSACQKANRERMTRLDFVFEGPDPGSAGARPKTIYVAGDHYARIEQFADAHSDLKNVIIVNTPDVWIVDAARKTAGHSRQDPGLAVHNPMLGPEGPEDLSQLEYGHEAQFFKDAPDRVTRENWNGIQCEVREIVSGPYLVRLFIDEQRLVPARIEAFKDDERLFGIRYLSYANKIPFDPSLFRPSKDLAIVETDE